MNIVIIGAGISGLSTAYTLQKAGHTVTVFAKAFSPNITSNKAAAFWFPYHIRNDERGIQWCQASYTFYKALSADAATGISMQHLVKALNKDAVATEPDWLNYLPEGSLRIMQPNELQPGYVKGYDITVPLIETQLFLPYLMNELVQKGILFIQKEISNLEEAAADYDVLVNCSALGSAELCADENMVPIRGQVGLLSPKAGLPFYIDNEKPLYIVPRKDAVIVGGTYEENITTAVTEPATIQRLLNNAYEVFPQLKQQEVIGSWAGIRPFRSEVRVERQAGTNIVHNYGHGGSGFTLSFGCAEEVKNIIDRF